MLLRNHLLSSQVLYTLVLFSLLLSTLILRPCLANAQTAQFEGNNTAVRPVESGSAGYIKPEDEYRSDAESQFGSHIHGLWESRYVTEGIDNLDGNSLFSVSSEINIADFSFVPWVARSEGADYTELNLNFVYGLQWQDNLTAYLAYTHIRASELDERSHDNEINLELYYLGLKHIQLIATLYHSFQADGAFMQAAAIHNTQINEQTHLKLLFLLGANAGYVPEGHNGVNHAQVRAVVVFNPSAKLELNGYIAYNEAINRDAARYSDDELLDDFTWGGLGISYRF